MIVISYSVVRTAGIGCVRVSHVCFLLGEKKQANTKKGKK